MLIRRILFVLGAIAGCLTFVLSLAFSLSSKNIDFLSACVRAVTAGGAIIILTWLLSGIVEKLGESPRRDKTVEDIQQAAE
ncbi:MAG: hypothetical protein ACYDBB_07010 [Armatimonadota bacterium]